MNDDWIAVALSAAVFGLGAAIILALAWIRDHQQ